MRNTETYRRFTTYFKSKYGAFEYRRGWLKSDCPFCGGAYKFGVNMGRNMAHCFKCDYTNTVFNTVMELEKFSTPTDLFSYLESIQESRVFREVKEKLIIPDRILPDSFLTLKYNVPGNGSPYYNYLTRKRNLEPGVIFKAKIGFVTDEKDPMFGYTVFPVFDRDNKRKVVYYQGRRLLTSGPKFKNPDQTLLGINKAEILYNGNILSQAKKVYIVESIINVLTLKFEAVAGLGKFFNPFVMNLFKKSQVEEFVIILDPDALSRAIKIAFELIYIKRIKLLVLPDNQDVNDVGYDYIKELESNQGYETHSSLIKLKNEHHYF